ncbi:MAG: DMT family transporter [Chloroflexi bacterium]|nr:DMT family transporter [Chloroflexota bacterium]
MPFTSVVYGLISALTWGAGDFSGGMAVKRSNPYGVVIVAHVISLFLLLALALFFGEPVPQFQDWILGGLAGICGGVGLTLLYRALASGQMSIAAPVSALVTASLPVMVGFITDGLVGWLTIIGFALALVAVWLVSGGVGLRSDLRSLILPVIAGLAFGGFFIFIHYASSESILWPLVAVRIVSISSLLLYSIITRQDWFPKRESLFAILMSSVMDTAGNAFYVLSAQTGRMDVAAVLGSLYPGSTVVLAWFVLKERISRVQMLGIALALIAIVLITI